MLMDENYKNQGVSEDSQTPFYSQGVALKKCPNCRADIDADSVYCEYCGSKIGDSISSSVNVSPNTPQGSKPKAPLGTGALVFSIIGLGVLFFTLLIADEVDEDLDILVGLVAFGGIAASVIGMVMGIVGSKKIKGNYSAYSDAPKLTVGKILGIIGLVIWSLVMLLGIILVLVDEGIEGFL